MTAALELRGLAKAYVRGKQVLDRLKYGLWPAGTNAPPPKVDVWGREIDKYSFGAGAALSDWMYRMAVPANLVDASKVDPLDRLILNWNNEHPNEVYAPDTPARFFDVKRGDGSEKRVNMTDEQYHAYAVASGQMAHDLLRGMKMDPEKPKRDDITAIEKVMSRSRRAVLLDMFAKQFAENSR